MIVCPNADLNKSIPRICQCQGCNLVAIKHCRTIPLPKHIALCDHCAIDLRWHGVVEVIHDESGINKASKGKVEI